MINKKAFGDGDLKELKHVEHELRRVIKQAKVGYRKKLKKRLQHNNTREVWRENCQISARQKSLTCSEWV